MSVAEEVFDNSPLRAIPEIGTYGDKFRDFVVYHFLHRLTYKVSAMHDEFFELIKCRQVGIASPRSFGKSVFFSVFYPLFLALTEPGSLIIFVSATAMMATKLLREVKRELEGNVGLQEEFGNQLSDKWREDHIILANGSEIMARSVTAQIRGLHPKVMILDDAESDEETMNPDGRDQFEKFVKNVIMPTLNFESCQLFMVGTILHPESFLNRVVLGREPGWTSRLYRAITRDGDSLWPHLWPMARLLDVKRDRGTDAFEQEYMNNPIPDGKRAFKKEWFKYVKKEYVPKEVCRFVTVDPAIGQSNENDDTVICISSMDSDKNIYVEECIGGKMTPNEIIQSLFEIYERKKIMVTGIETQGFQKTLMYQFNDESRRRHVYPVLEELKSDSRRKEWRIRALQPYFENNKVYFVEGAPGIDQLERQLLTFPTARHDDYCFVAGTLIATLSGDKAIETMKVGDRVLTPFGAREVLASGHTGSREVMSKFGLEATPNHPVFSRNKNSFIPFVSSSSTYMSQLSRLTLKELLLWRYQKLLYSMEHPTILMGREGIIAAAKERMERGSILRDFMSRFLNFIRRRKFRKVVLFITKTAILSIMTSLTWSAYRLANIKAGMQQNFGRMQNLAKRLAAFVGNLIFPIIWTQSSAQGNALIKMPEIMGDGDLARLALCAEKNTLDPISTFHQKPVDINAGRSSVLKNVYNLTVDSDGCYFANGILVSNCDALAYVLQIVRPGMKAKEPPPHPESFEGTLLRLEQEKNSTECWGNNNLQ